MQEVLDQSLNDPSKMYQLLMNFASLEPLKIKILLILAHLAPQRVTATELTLLLGYSRKARTIYRGVLDELEQAGFIIVDKITPKRFSIQISQHHPLMSFVIELAIDQGELYTNTLLDLLGDKS